MVYTQHASHMCFLSGLVNLVPPSAGQRNVGNEVCGFRE